MITKAKQVTAIEKLLTEGYLVQFRHTPHRGLFSATAMNGWQGIQECGVGTSLSEAISNMLDKQMPDGRKDE